MNDDESLLRSMADTRKRALKLSVRHEHADELEAMRAVLALVRAHDVDAERWRALLTLATKWPQTVLVVNINIGHDWHTADAPEQIQEVVDAAIDAARGKE